MKATEAMMATAMHWHGGQNTMMYALGSTGDIQPGMTQRGRSALLQDLMREVNSVLQYDTLSEKEIDDLASISVWATREYDREMCPLGEREVRFIAEMCHNVLWSYSQCLGDLAQEPWRSAPEWQKETTIDGVYFTIANVDKGPAGSHDNWMATKRCQGWVLGDVKDPEKKTHPLLVPFSQLPREHQAKDYIFYQVVHSLKSRFEDGDIVLTEMYGKE